MHSKYADGMCTTPSLTEIEDSEFDALKTRIESRPRLCGYYILGLVSIREFRDSNATQESILEHVINYFDDDPTEPDPNFVSDHGWVDYETDHDRARAHAIESLVGGSQIGHTRHTMTELQAAKAFDEFLNLCGPNPRFYIGMGIGDRKYVFQYGVLIVANSRGGMLWVVESD